MRINPEKVLKLLNEMGTREEMRAHDWPVFKGWAELHEYATEALYYEIANKKGGKVEESRRRAALKFLKDCKIEGRDNIFMGNSWITDGYQFLSNGDIAFRFSPENHIDGLPEVDKSKDHHIPSNIEIVLDYKHDMTDEAMITRQELEIAIVKWKTGEQDMKHPHVKAGLALYNAELLLKAIKIIGVNEATIRQKTWRDSGHIDINGREAVFMPLRPIEGLEVYKFLDNGVFIVGDSRQRITKKIYTNHPMIHEARERPEVIAGRLMMEERNRRKHLEPTEADEANWKLLEWEDAQQLCA